MKVFITDWLAQNVQWMPFITQRTVWLTAPVLVVGAMALSVVASTISLRTVPEGVIERWRFQDD